MESEKALRGRVAQLNPYHSVSKVYFLQRDERYYIGVKNVAQIPDILVRKLEATGKYVLHTLDASSLGGRAVDILIPNPITGNCMTGSSSGTAVNVLIHLNDVGIGTDGGGSVLAPAMSCNLYGFISPLFEEEYMKQFTKKSTDGIIFTPSIGFMTKELNLLKETIGVFLKLSHTKKSGRILIDDQDETSYLFDTTKIVFPDKYGSREPLIAFLQDTLKKCDFLVSYEGPVDVKGFGDTVFGHFDKECQMIQRAACKGFIRVANMVNATALCIPDTALGRGWVFICESKQDKISYMLEMASKMPAFRDELISRYFGNLDMYFPKEYMDKSMLIKK